MPKLAEASDAKLSLQDLDPSANARDEEGYEVEENTFRVKSSFLRPILNFAIHVTQNSKSEDLRFI
ncbi:hypothetical protein COY07_00640 [Candidatus Peregrinibacteria bacterium CG_4_10_14_0_2_um_filter_43_11]|nr:MAG: hypothetical protein COY07_00640 [Candidatus Peregrinibacteria bacterium CG_4_10_14_0_2_um_filter_43_11]